MAHCGKLGEIEDFPHPLGPVIERISPLSTSKLTSSKTTFPPNFRFIFLIFIALNWSKNKSDVKTDFFQCDIMILNLNFTM